MTASVLARNQQTPPIIAQFGGITSECVQPSVSDPNTGMDASGSAATIVNGISFAGIGQIYFGQYAGGSTVQ